MHKSINSSFKLRPLAAAVAIIGINMMAVPLAQAGSLNLGDLLVSSTTYVDPGFGVGAALPNSKSGSGVASAASGFCNSSDCVNNVWNNSLASSAVPGTGGNDGNFGTTSGIMLRSVNANTGAVTGSLDVTAAAAAQGLNLVTSFASKSELALNVTPDGRSVTFMGYNNTTGRLDVSNSATPGISGATYGEPGNTDTANTTFRGVAQLNVATGALQYTTTNAYAGNNGRAAILGSNGLYYTAGNAGNGNGSSLITGANGIQLITPGSNAPSTPSATPGTNAIGAFNITQLCYTADKTAKDSNYRGLTVFNNTLYATKGSGGNGINTIYQIGTAGSLPTGTGAATPVTVLPGMNTSLASATNTPHPFGIWFANDHTLYVADEGSGKATDFTDKSTKAGGLQKYVLQNGTWNLAYTLGGDIVGQSYTATGQGSLAGISLNVTTDGFRNLTGRVNDDGTVSLFTVTSTEGSVLGDAGAEPNKLVYFTDNLSYGAADASTATSTELATTLMTASVGEAIRGVALPVPEPESYALALMSLGILGVAAKRQRRQG